MTTQEEYMGKLEGKMALLTGGTSGIGLATARLCIAGGPKVAITGRSKKTLDAAAAEIGKNNLSQRRRA